MNQTILKVAGLDCPAEEKLLRKALEHIKGVESLECNFITQELMVKHQSVEPATLLTAIQKIGMQAELKKDDITPESLEGIGASKKDWIVIVLSGFIAVGAEIASYILTTEKSLIVLILSLLAILLGGRTTLKKGIQALRTFTLNINFLMMIAIIGAFVIGEWPEAAVVTVLFALAELIERYSLDRARHAIQGLMAMAPEEARVLDQNGVWQEVPLKEIQLGAIIWVKPGERIPLDGAITKGESSINQAPVTGESIPVDKGVGDEVFAGTLNEHGSFEFKVTATQNQTMLAKIIHAVAEAQQQRAPTQRFVDQFSRFYTPIMVILAVLIAIAPPLIWGQPFEPWIYKALVMLVIACPCALVISTPITVVSGLTAAAKQGILIKGGTYLEQGYKLKALAFDKTGTLTEGKPALTDVVVVSSFFTEEKLLHYAASLDTHSEHPIAKAIVKAYEDKFKKVLLVVDQFAAITGRGAKGIIDGQVYFVGNHQLAEDNRVCNAKVESVLESFEQQGKTTIVISSSKEVLGILAVADQIRATSTSALNNLHQMGIKTVMITGDNPLTAKTIAEKVSIDEIYANQLPQQKLKVIETLLKTYGYVGMVGDGMNDAPALAKASIGFAMGAAGNDTALETADVALMEDNLQKVANFLRISRTTKIRLIQNISFAISVKLVFFILALLGEATLWMAVFADMGASLIVVLNGLRILRAKQ